MQDYVTLLGSEEVGRAGTAMKSAAFTIAQAANQIDTSNAAVIQQMNDAVTRFENVVEKLISALQGSRLSQPDDFRPEGSRSGRIENTSSNVTEVERGRVATVESEPVVGKSRFEDETA